MVFARIFFFFFFQAEDGIRDLTVTGVQTCALPIWRRRRPSRPCSRALAPRRSREAGLARRQLLGPDEHLLAVLPLKQQRLVRDLDPIPIDPECAEDGVVVHL